MIDARLKNLLQQPPYSLRQGDKERALLPILQDLVQHHRTHCPAYRRITDWVAPHGEKASRLEDLPFLPATLFKFRHLRSIPAERVRTTVTSSGTTNTAVSNIDLDDDMTRLSTRALGRTIDDVTARRRLPFLIIDTEDVLQNTGGLKARAAAILGLMPHGRDYCFALNSDLRLNKENVTAFLKRHGNDDFLIFGFTYLVWQSLLATGKAGDFDLSCGILLHSGGWKKLQDQAIDNASFKIHLKQSCGLTKIMNFYGMAELPGTIFLENDDELLYPPSFADIIIRDPIHFEPVSQGQSGLIQIISALPHSYPGHSILTEDIGVIESVDSGVQNRFGKGFRILGRAPRAELRGCSNVIAESLA